MWSKVGREELADSKKTSFNRFPYIEFTRFIVVQIVSFLDFESPKFETPGKPVIINWTLEGCISVLGSN